MNDRRSAPRIKVAFNATCIGIDRDLEQFNRKVQVNDLSIGGCQINAGCAVHSQLRLLLSIPGEHVVAINARVRNQSRDACGVEFVGASPQAIEAICRAVFAEPTS